MNSETNYLTILIYYKDHSLEISCKNIIQFKELIEKCKHQLNLTEEDSNTIKLYFMEENGEKIEIKSYEEIMENAKFTEDDNLKIVLNLEIKEKKEIKSENIVLDLDNNYKIIGYKKESFSQKSIVAINKNNKINKFNHNNFGIKGNNYNYNFLFNRNNKTDLSNNYLGFKEINNENLFNDIKKYNCFISKKLLEIENQFKIREKKINELTEVYRTKIAESQNYIHYKNQIIEDLEKESIEKDKELEMQRQINDELTKQEENLKKLIKELEEKYKKEKEKKNDIKNNESKYSDKDFKNLEEISKGAYGTVYSAFSIKDNLNLCLKKIDINLMQRNYYNNLYPENNYFKDLNNEIKILKLLSSHKNSVKFFGDYQIIKEKTIVMEKCDEDLEQFMIKRNKSFNIDEIRKIFIDLNELFKIMYKNNIIHRDLKLKNFLIKYTDEQKTDFIVKLCDYGIGKFLDEKNINFSGVKGTAETLAPEICLFKTNKYENIVDIFSLGIIFYQLSHEMIHPFKDNKYDNNFLFKYYEYYDNDTYKIKFSDSIQNEDFKNLVMRMLKLNPKNRITWEQYFEHPFFK